MDLYLVLTIRGTTRIYTQGSGHGMPDVLVTSLWLSVLSHVVGLSDVRYALLSKLPSCLLRYISWEYCVVDFRLTVSVNNGK